MPTTLRRSLIAAATIVFVVVSVSLLLLRPGYLKKKAEQTLSGRLGLQVTIAELSVSIWPRPRVTVTGMVFIAPSQPDFPPFIAIDRAWADVGLFSAWRGHVTAVHAEGLRISVPPAPDRSAGAGNARMSRFGEGGRGGDVIVDRLEAHDAVLTILRRDPDREPLEFRIHRLRVNDVGFDRVMTFSAALTNPVPEGLVQSDGWFGPWNKVRPTDIALGGKYTFSLANLGTIRGIGGTLTSTGTYEGHLTAIAITGQTEMPDFSLDMGGKPVPLTTRFSATVNGSDGSTVLDRVDAMLIQTPITVRGRVDNLPGPGRRQIELTADVTDGRIEDLLALVVDSARPLLVGDVSLTSRISLPPGKSPVRDRLVLGGAFGLDQATFTERAVQAKLIELSRRSQGKSEDERAVRVLTRLHGKFTLVSGVLRLNGVTFLVPGALVTVDGTYTMATSALDLQGTLRMEASLSGAVGGFKSILLRPFDQLFRRDGAGAVIPITIRGTHRRPEVGINIRRVLGRKLP